MTARTIRNNSPFALISNDNWKGKVGIDDQGFTIFSNPIYGVRAGFINLYTTYLQRGLDTPNKIFPVYAPFGHGSNNPLTYIQSVKKLEGIQENEKIDSLDKLKKLGRAIIKVEAGTFWVNENDFNDGFTMAIEDRNLDKYLVVGGISLATIGIVSFIVWYLFIKE